MVFSWFNRGLDSRRRGSGFRKRPARKSERSRLLRAEPLEARALLSASMSDWATTFHRPIPAGNGTVPLATSGPTGYSPAQVRHAYGFDKITFNNGTVPGDGSGTTIAIVDAYDDPNIANDLHQFDAAFGLPDSTFTKVNQSGGTSYPAANAGWITEIALDVEWAHAIAPKASILLVEASDASYGNLMTAVNYAKSQPGVVAVSASWGGGEFSGEKTYDSYFTTPAGHTGVTFFVSSGDAGAPISYPAASPNVVAIGGTTLSADSQGNYSSESGWSGSGGGLSAYESQPTYQKGVVTQSTTARANPDIAYDSNPNTGFPVYDSYNNGTVTPWGQWGGTSDAAPQWAALVAIADQGRASIGKAALDGVAQTLPLLYSIAAGDFHDITGGTSTGTPNYPAATGYDLVTGRGSPYANLVVNDLVGVPPVPAATHFSVVASASSTAGTTLSVTVTALDASNNLFPGYLGTVHFTSSDAGATLPADYQFTAADNGLHTFTTVALVTAGSQTLTATDTVSSSITGKATVSITPAAADHLLIGQQPTSAAPGATLNPAVTVKVVDAYNNVVTADNADQVTIALGTNPSGATLGGTATVTVSGGVATFGNLSVNLAGAGYTLAASSGTLGPATSAAFNVAAATTLEGFESGNLNAYTVVGARTASVSVSTTAKHDGAYGLLDTNGNDWVYRNDAAAQVKQGDTISVWLDFSGSANGTASFGFGATATGTLALVASPANNQLLLQNAAGYRAKTIGSAAKTWLANHWYRMEINWGTNGAIVGKVFDSDGTTLLQTVKATTTSITAGGIGFNATGRNNKFWDTVQRTPGVNQALAVRSANEPSNPGGGGAIPDWMVDLYFGRDDS